MLLYYPFWMFMGFTLHFYIIFGTNLLTGGPTRIAVFAYFSVLKKRNIKRSPNGMKPSGAIFLEQKQTWRLGVDVKQQTRRRPPPSWAPRALTDLLLPPIYPRTPKTSRSTMKNNFHRRILEPLPALRRRGNRPRRASTSSPRLIL